MELSTLKGQIKTNSLQSFYVFYGPETEMMKVYINQIKKVTNREICYIENINRITQKLHNFALLKNAEICVLRDCKDFISTDKINAVISSIIAQKQYIFILIYSTLDKRTKFYKQYAENHIVEFEHLKTDILLKYVQKEIDLNETYARALIEICENDYSRILLEIDKIKTFISANTTIKSADEALKYLVQDGTIYQPPYDAVFDFVDAVLKNKPNLAFELLQESYDSGEATLVLLTNLYNSTKQLLQVQSYEGTNLAGATGLNGFQIKLAKERIGKYSDEKLVNFLRQIKNTETGIKIGTIDESTAVLQLLVQFWS